MSALSKRINETLSEDLTNGKRNEEFLFVEFYAKIFQKIRINAMIPCVYAMNPNFSEPHCRSELAVAG